MKSIITNHIGQNRPYPMPEDIQCHSDIKWQNERSCFYNFGADSSLEFTGFTKEPNSPFIESIVDMF